MRIAVAATPGIAIPTLDWIISSEHSLELVITRPDKKSGRGNALHESQVGQWAKAQKIRVVKPKRAHELQEILAGIDLVVTIAYGVILPDEILNVPQHGFINVHFSLLPAWRGAAPVQRAIESGALVTGITVFKLDPGMDTGPTYNFDEVSIENSETSGELLIRLAARAPVKVMQAIAMIERGEAPVSQPSVGVSHAAKIAKDESRVVWSDSSTTLSRRIRGFNPEPGSWTQWKGARIGINRARVGEINLNLSPGEIAVVDHQLIVGCGESSALIVEEVQPAGKRSMQSHDWLNGARCVTGDFFD